VNGRLRDKFEAAADIGEQEMKEKALHLERIQALIAGKQVRKVICIENRLVNIVI
jgi:leucyl-tRNA synthetase